MLLGKCDAGLGAGLGELGFPAVLKHLGRKAFGISTHLGLGYILRESDRLMHPAERPVGMSQVPKKPAGLAPRIHARFPSV